MYYSVQQLATLAGVSVRTLHHYDDIGLLKPARVQSNGYRKYGEEELLKLQQILFFRELDFSLEEIAKIITSPSFDMEVALNDQRNLIELKAKRLHKLIKTIDKTIKKINHKTIMKDQELYDSFKDPEQAQYAEEAKERWGNTEAYKESQKRVAKMTKEDMELFKKRADELMQAIAKAMPKGATSIKMQKLIAEHYYGLRNFYEPSLEMYRGLANMYVDDPRFTAYYEEYAVGLAQVMKEAMHYFADTQEKK